MIPEHVARVGGIVTATNNVGLDNSVNPMNGTIPRTLKTHLSSLVVGELSRAPAMRSI